MNILDNDFKDNNEKLYRAIIPIDAFWDEENNRPTSGAFKDNKGLSVDRQGNRNNIEAVQTLLKSKRQDSKIVSINIQDCKSVPVFPIYKPLNDNVYHSEIHDSQEKIGISGSKCKKLSLAVKLEEVI